MSDGLNDGSKPVTRHALLARLPAVHELLDDQRIRGFIGRLPRPLVVSAAQELLERERERILKADQPEAPVTDELAHRLGERLERELVAGPQIVLNATGVVLHTNLGRAPLAEAAIARIVEVARSYSTLELNLEEGRRGHRDVHVEPLLREVTGAEAAFAVNNGAGAILLALSTIAGAGQGVVVSRGELIEIGGSFRVPDILHASGARLVEVGTTNRTHLRDYQVALERATEPIAALLKVHPSNYRVVGFHTEVSVRSLRTVAEANEVPLIVDLGSGCLEDLSAHGAPSEPVVGEVLRDGATIVTFSGDKLLGGPQAGILAGDAALIAAMKRNPLARALRADKLTLAGLAATLRLHLDPAAREGIPTLRMIIEPGERVRTRADQLLHELSARGVNGDVLETQAAVGGGSLPGEHLPSWAVALRSETSAAELERRLRLGRPAVVARVRDDRVLLDMRTVRDDQLLPLADAVTAACNPNRARETDI